MDLKYSERANASPGSIVGVAAYRPRWNEILWSSFEVELNLLNSNAFQLQLPCSWGALYYAKPWKMFRQTYSSNRGRERLLRPLPRSQANFWTTSWKRPFLRYMVEQHWFMIYPARASYSTSLVLPGVHHDGSSALKYLFQTPLASDGEVKKKLLPEMVN